MKIPEYIENYIYDELGGFYETGTNIDTNIENSENDNKRYLGTYFPRSLIENFVILRELYENEKIKETINNLDKINILDYGTGTGGNILGFMHFFKKINFPSEKVQFVTLEGNKNAIEYQVKLFRKFNAEYGTKFKLIYATKKFSTTNFENEGNSILTHINEKFQIEKYDFITTFKFLSEFYNSNYQLAKGQELYKKFIEFNERYLTEKGILLLLDLVSGNYDRNNPRPFTTQIMSNEAKSCLQNNNNNMKILIPISCALWSSNCRTNSCYIQRTFEIEHNHITGNYLTDKSNISYFILAKNIYVNDVLENLTFQNSYSINQNWKNPGYCENGIQIKGSNNKATGFKIN